MRCSCATVRRRATGSDGRARARRQSAQSARAACAASHNCARIVPHATFVPIRGNVDTRLRKLDAGECDALVLAGAGVKRLGLAARISAYLPIETCVPAPGQGIVAVQIRVMLTERCDRPSRGSLTQTPRRH